MASNNEPAKLLLPYLQRADELQNHEPLVAYYCRLYAMERGLMIPQSNRTETTKSILVSLMKQLEKDKKSIKLGPDDNLHVEGFALNVFAKADKQDRAGRADLSTAKTFYAANIFFEILNQFGELQPDIEQKQKYAAWKAADIRKAVKEGRKPIPGGPGGDNDSSLPSSASSEHDLQPNRDDFADSSTRADSTARTAPDSDSSPRQYSHANIHHFSSFSQPPSNVTPPPSLTIPPSHYAGNNYSSETIHLPPTTNNSEHSISHQPHHHQPQPHFPQQYPSHDASPYSYPNFQSYPSFSESSLPSAPSHYPSHYQGSDASYTSLSPSNAAPYVSTPQYNSSGRNGNVPEVSPTATERYEYDSNYQPPPEKIAEAHKAARFAVGALAFDDVSTAVDYLKKSLELLTNPSADH